MKKAEYKEEINKLSVKLGELQRICQSAKIPVMIVFEGLDASGKRRADWKADSGTGSERL